MFKIDKNWKSIDDQVSRHSAHTRQKSANFWNVQSTDEWENIDAQGYADSNWPGRLLPFEEETQDEVVQEVWDKRIGAEKEEENRQTKDKCLHISELEHV